MLTRSPNLAFHSRRLKVPKRTKRMHTLLGATLHHLVVALAITRNEDDLCTKSLPSVPQQLHGIRATTTLLAVPENHALGLNVLVDETSDCGAKSTFLVGADPDEEPVG